MKKAMKCGFTGKILVLLLVMLLSVALTSCSGSTEGEDALAETSVQAESTGAVAESTPETVTESTSEAIAEFTPEVTSETTENTVSEASSNDAAKTGSKYISDNKYILNFIGKLSKLAPDLGISFSMDAYTFGDENIKSTPEGRVSNTGDYYEDNQVMVGLGYNMDNEDMWYVSFEAPLPGLSDWFNKYYFATVSALSNNPIPTGSTYDEIVEFMNSMYNALVAEGKDNAIQMGDYVFVFKNTSENRAVFAVDTISYFDAYYKGTIDLTVLGAE